MSCTPGNPPAPVNSTEHIVRAYNDPAIRRECLDLPVHAYGHHAPAVEYLPVENVDRSAGDYIIIRSSHQGIHHPPAPEHFVL